MDAYNGKIAQLIVDKFKAEVWAELQLQALLDVQQADAEPVGRDLAAGQLSQQILRELGTVVRDLQQRFLGGQAAGDLHGTGVGDFLQRVVDGVFHQWLRNHGRYVQMGVLSDLVTADWNTIGDGKELTIIGSHLSAKVYPAVIRGIEKGLIKTDGLISHCFKLQDWAKAYETAEKDPAAVKIMLEP